MRRIPLLERGVVRRDDERDVGDAGVGERAQRVVEKRHAVDRHHRFETGVRRRLLLRQEGSRGIVLAHPCTEAAGQDDRAPRHGREGDVYHAYMCTMSSGGVVFASAPPLGLRKSRRSMRGSYARYGT